MQRRRKLANLISILNLINLYFVNQPLARYRGQGENDRVEFVKYKPGSHFNNPSIGLNIDTSLIYTPGLLKNGSPSFIDEVDSVGTAQNSDNQNEYKKYVPNSQLTPGRMPGKVNRQTDPPTGVTRHDHHAHRNENQSHRHADHHPKRHAELDSASPQPNALQSDKDEIPGQVNRQTDPPTGVTRHDHHAHRNENQYHRHADHHPKRHAELDSASPQPNALQSDKDEIPGQVNRQTDPPTGVTRHDHHAHRNENQSHRHAENPKSHADHHPKRHAELDSASPQPNALQSDKDKIPGQVNRQTDPPTGVTRHDGISGGHDDHVNRNKNQSHRHAENPKSHADPHQRHAELDSASPQPNALQSDKDEIPGQIRHDANGRVYINKDKYFEGISESVWNYHIGGYQVLHKYLKDRKGRIMDEAPRYCRIVTALYHTIEIQKEIDLIYPKVEQKLIEFDQ